MDFLDKLTGDEKWSQNSNLKNCIRPISLYSSDPIVYAKQRILIEMANDLPKSLFSVITGQGKDKSVFKELYSKIAKFDNLL